MKIEGLTLPELRDLAESTVTVASAYEAGVFDVLADGPADAGEVARRAGLDRRAVAIVLPALVDLGLLEPAGAERYRPTEECRAHLCDPRTGAFEGGGLPHWLENLRGWTRLPDVLRTGEPVPHGGLDRDGETLRRFMAAMAAAPPERIRRIADLCLSRAPGARRILDVGGGPGLMAREFVSRGLEATLVDTPQAVALVADEYGLADVEHLHLVGGDFNEGLPKGPFDVVLMSNVVHIYGPARNEALLRRAAEVMAPGGVLAVADFLRGRSPRAARFALVMLMRTEEGNTYRREDVAAWMEGAGLEDLQVDDLDPDRQLVTARRPGGSGSGHGDAPARDGD